jgi:hypothetical protein
LNNSLSVGGGGGGRRKRILAYLSADEHEDRLIPLLPAALRRLVCEKGSQ